MKKEKTIEERLEDNKYKSAQKKLDEFEEMMELLKPYLHKPIIKQLPRQGEWELDKQPNYPNNEPILIPS